MHAADQPKLPRRQQADRRALGTAVAAQLKALARRAGWRVARGWLFREYDGWFVEVWVNVHVYAFRTTVAMMVKPMAIDPIFWDIVGLPENRDQPLSFRMFGAWTCSTPSVFEDEISESGGQVVAAERVLEWSNARLAQATSSLTPEAFVESLRDVHRQSPLFYPYFATFVCCLVLTGRNEEAVALCAEAIGRGEHGGFTAGDKDFPGMAREWLAGDMHNGRGTSP